MKKSIAAILFIFLTYGKNFSQQTINFDLTKLAIQNNLTVRNREITVIEEDSKKFIELGKKMVAKPVWLPIDNFEEGKVELIARGKDILQGSFYGIAFHAENDSTFEVVYCRPFNFQTKDSLRKIHAVQYGYFPRLDWQVLRKSHPGLYESGILNPPKANDWVTLTIIVDSKEIKVFINHASQPTLVAKKLNTSLKGKIGIFGFNSDVERFRLIPSSK